MRTLTLARREVEIGVGVGGVVAVGRVGLRRQSGQVGFSRLLASTCEQHDGRMGARIAFDHPKPEMDACL